MLIEAKKHQSAEMFSAQNVNCKALHECIFYYFRERENKRLINTSIKFLIITDFYQFYIFKASEFDRLFYKNTHFKKLYKNFTDKNSLFKGNTEKFYNECKKILDSPEYLDSIQEKKKDSQGKSQSRSPQGFHLDFKALFDKINSNDFKAIRPFFKALSPEFLFDTFNPNDANSLNKDSLNFWIALILAAMRKKANS